jgi:hypothetical protein
MSTNDTKESVDMKDQHEDEIIAENEQLSGDDSNAPVDQDATEAIN